MAKIKQKRTNPDTGEEEEIEVEVFTAEETDAKIKAVEGTLTEAHKKELEKATGEIATFTTEKAALQKKIDDLVAAGINADNPNFKVLKEALDKKDQDIAGLKTVVETFVSKQATEAMDAKIKIASKGDKKLEEKIRFHLKETVPGLKEDSEENRTKKVEAALKLASDNSGSGPGIFDGGTGGGGYGQGGNGGGEQVVEFTARERALGSKLGISDADYKKYGPKVARMK